MQLQINYYDWETAQRAKEQYEMVEARGIPCIIMEPVRGGSLASPHPDVVSLLTAAAPKASPASWALRFAGSLPNTAVVLSGMSDMAQVTENLRLCGFQALLKHITVACVSIKWLICERAYNPAALRIALNAANAKATAHSILPFQRSLKGCLHAQKPK